MGHIDDVYLETMLLMFIWMHKIIYMKIDMNGLNCNIIVKTGFLENGEYISLENNTQDVTNIVHCICFKSSECNYYEPLQ